MNNNREYLKGAKRLQIINRWLRGLEDPEYEVYPTRKEGKYIIKKRKKALEQTENENEQIANEESDNEDNEDKEGSNEYKEEYKDDSIDKDKNKDNIEVDDNKNKYRDNDREDNIEDPLNPLFKARLQTKFDPLYINLQILSELQQVNEYLRREMERKDRNELLKSLVDEAMNQMYKNKEDKKDESDDSSSEEEVYHYYHQPYVRKNTIFADIKR
ncbi:hypothetical protein M9Y10_041460 [Tritrichomonas musculus]|uniref:Uncharacterized protein n=1 Tax=Tritrichomonas musculus TaxID=1915356 RepID=A0ABR2K4E6_9EUKA